MNEQNVKVPGQQSNRDVRETSGYDTPAETQPSQKPRELKPNQMSDKALVAEVRELHEKFATLSNEYEQGPPARRAEIRNEMKPLVNRERELREEFAGRLSSEFTQDRVPAQQFGIGR
jgi:predicted  nucleic acid-binding Zn-ribbon protein